MDCQQQNDAIRKILSTVTPETCLSASAQIVALGLPAYVAFQLVMQALYPRT